MKQKGFVAANTEWAFSQLDGLYSSNSPDILYSSAVLVPVNGGRILPTTSHHALPPSIVDSCKGWARAVLLPSFLPIRYLIPDQLISTSAANNDSIYRNCCYKPYRFYRELIGLNRFLHLNLNTFVIPWTVDLVVTLGQRTHGIHQHCSSPTYELTVALLQNATYKKFMFWHIWEFGLWLDRPFMIIFQIGVLIGFLPESL